MKAVSQSYYSLSEAVFSQMCSWTLLEEFKLVSCCFINVHSFLWSTEEDPKCKQRGQKKVINGV